MLRFYGTNLPNIKEKAEHCGYGKFLLIIVEDEKPIYEKRNTTKGEKIVNINLFDSKEKFRELTGGGHKVHATNDEIETNHDITLLLDKNLEDYMKQEEINEEKQKMILLKKELFGANGWKNVNDIFYVLNNCINYAILRNYENLPDEIYVNDHNDIDILCDSCQNAAYLLNAEKVFQESYRVHYKVRVGNKYANFDLRFIGDNYYIKELEERILNNRVFNVKGFYTLKEDDYFYTLLYHALIHKNIFKDDYKIRLSNMKPELIKKETTEEDMLNILKEWLKQNDYIAIKPEDKSVYYNLENLKQLGPCVFKEEEYNLQVELEILKSENEKLRQEILCMANSKSWKITKPLRDFTTRKRLK